MKVTPTPGNCRLRALPYADSMAFAVAFNGSCQASYSSTDDQDIDPRRRIALDIVICTNTICSAWRCSVVYVFFETRHSDQCRDQAMVLAGKEHLYG